MEVNNTMSKSNNFKPNNFKNIQNFAKLGMKIITQSPLLIKSGEEDPLEESNNPRFLRSHDIHGREVCIIPGSTIKGFIRGNLERISTYLKKGDKIIPNRFGYTHFNKPKNTRKENNASNIYCNQFIAHHPQFEIRPQIAINPKTQATRHGALLNLESVSTGTVFEGSIKLRNWDIRLLGMLGIIIDLANKGLISLGSNKSRGFGVLKFEIEKLTIQILGGENNSICKYELDENSFSLILPNNKVQFKSENITDIIIVNKDFPLYDEIILSKELSQELLNYSVNKITI